MRAGEAGGGDPLGTFSSIWLSTPSCPRATLSSVLPTGQPRVLWWPEAAEPGPVLECPHSARVMQDLLTACCGPNGQQGRPCLLVRLCGHNQHPEDKALTPWKR